MKNKIDIFGTTYKIKYVDKIEPENPDDFLWGCVIWKDKLIKIATKDTNGNNLTEDEIKLSLLHELMHFYLSTGQYNHLVGDEPLVEWLARCVLATIKQKVI